MNDNGTVAGWTIQRFGEERQGFIFDGNDVTLLEGLPGAVSATAEAIDNLGRVIGYSVFESAKDGSSWARAFLWSSGQTIDLGTVSGRTRSRAMDINDIGQVVGHVYNAGFTDFAAFIWQNGVMSNLNDLVPAGLGVDIQFANAINANGQIVGSGSMASGHVGVLLTPRAPLGDLDLDCNVGIKDLLRLLSLWGPCDGCRADLDGDGIVDQDDLSLLLASWM